MRYETRLRALEGRHTDRGDAELAGKVAQARARVDADDRERGIVRPPRDPLEFPPGCTGLAEQIVWARDERARRSEAHR